MYFGVSLFFFCVMFVIFCVGGGDFVCIKGIDV